MMTMRLSEPNLGGNQSERWTLLGSDSRHGCLPPAVPFCLHSSCLWAGFGSPAFLPHRRLITSLEAERQPGRRHSRDAGCYL